MAMKKSRLLIATVPLVIVVTLGVLAMLPPSPGVTKAKFDRIEKGMTRAEVEAIFGRPREPIPTIGGWLYWDSDDGSVAAFGFELFNDCVTDKHWVNSTETILDKCRRWLHLP